MKSTCGYVGRAQIAEKTERKDPSCSLIKYFSNQKMTVRTVLDNNGKKFDYIYSLPPPENPPKAIIHSGTNYDGSALYWPYEVTNQLSSIIGQHSRQFIYVNLLLFHQGNHLPFPGFARTRTEKTKYGFRVARFQIKFNYLMTALNKFIVEMEEKNEPLLIILLGEHGFPLSPIWPHYGSLRDIPSPKVAIVPFAFKLIGPGASPHRQTHFTEQPVTYYHLGWLLNKFVTTPGSQFDSLRNLIPDLEKLEPFPFVGETDNWLVMERSGRYYFRNQNGRIWWQLH